MRVLFGRTLHIPTRYALPIVLVLGAVALAEGQQTAPATPILVREIGLDDGPIIFDDITWLAVRPRGDIIVAEPRLGLVRLIDPGTLEETVVGGRGAGPGEFRAPSSVGHVGDSVWVWDPGLARLTVFLPDLEVARIQRLPLVGAPVAPLGAGGVVGPGRVASVAGEPLRRLWIVDPEGEVVRDSLVLEAGATGIVLESGGVRNQIWQPWSEASLWAPSWTGDGFVVVDRSTSGPPVVHVHRYDRAGRLAWSASLSYEPVPITRTHVEAMAERISSGVRDFARRRGIPIDAARFSPAAVARQLHVPTRFPPVSAVALGESGHVYLRRAVAPGSNEAEYWILDRTGQVTSSVRLPEDFRLFYADARSLWGTRHGPEWQVYIAEYRISR
jgi:hypothetical protein